MIHPDFELTATVINEFLSEKTAQGTLMHPHYVSLGRTVEEWIEEYKGRLEMAWNPINPITDEPYKSISNPDCRGSKDIFSGNETWNGLFGYKDSLQISFSSGIKEDAENLIFPVCAFKAEDKSVSTIMIAPMNDTLRFLDHGGHLVFPTSSLRGIFWGCDRPMHLEDLNDQDIPIIYHSIQYASEDTHLMWRALIRSERKVSEKLKDAITAGLEDFPPQKATYTTIENHQYLIGWYQKLRIQKIKDYLGI